MTQLTELEGRSATEPFRGFRCWSHDAVGTVFDREAAAAARSILLATHQPPRIKRVAITAANRFTDEGVVDQDAVLAAVRAKNDAGLIVPVIGASGTGKSHLVLWLRAMLEQEKSTHRKIIYVPKGKTSLSGVIELILDGRTGGKFDDLRDAVRTATHSMSLDERAIRFRNELGLAIRAVDADAGGPGLRQYRQHIAQHLPALLHDEAYASRLLGAGGELRRIVERATEGESEEPAEFLPGDLGVDLTVSEQAELGAPARAFLGHLVQPQLHHVAIDVLNEVRDRCLSSVFGVQPTQLVEVMRELRVELHREDPHLELILMIEDFTLLQGIQFDLLEAMIELPRREGEQVMAAMRTVMAVTAGFFGKMLAASDTLRTRIAGQHHIYSLDVAYETAEPGSTDRETAIGFVGRYLNAARVGVEELTAADGHPPNACFVCAHRDRCHDAFGTATDAEYGLYPFNAAAIDRIIRARQERFNPRDMLFVLSQTLLTHSDEFPNGRFPSESWARLSNPRDFNRPTLPTIAIGVRDQTAGHPKPEQRTAMLTYWGGVPERLANLAPAIHEAFDVPTIADIDAVGPKPGPGPGPGPRPVPVVVDVVQQWADGVRLDAEYARAIRQAFGNAIIGALDPEARLYARGLVDRMFQPDRDVAIENAGGGGQRPRPGWFSVVFTNDDATAMLFQGVLHAADLNSWEFEGGTDRMVAFLNRAEEEASRLRAFIEERLQAERDHRDAALQLLALGGLVVGHGEPGSPEGLLDAALGKTPLPTDHLPERWGAMVKMLDQRRDALRDVAFPASQVRRGRTGDMAGVDGGAALPVFKELRKTWAVPVLSEEAPNQAVATAKILESRLAPALEQAYEQLRAWFDQVAPLVGDPERFSHNLKTAETTLEHARTKGFLVGGGGNVPAGTAQPAQVAHAVNVVGQILASWPELALGARIKAVTRIPWARLGPARDRVVHLAESLQRSIDKARAEEALTSGEGVSPIDEFDAALQRLEHVVSREEVA